MRKTTTVSRDAFSVSQTACITARGPAAGYRAASRSTITNGRGPAQDREMGGKRIQKRQAVIAVMAAANRDPERFPNPDRFDITRKDNRHLAFGYAAHFCFGAPLAYVEGQVVLEAFLRHFANVTLSPEHQSKNAQHSRMRDG